jgi:hypothetical protein
MSTHHLVSYKLALDMSLGHALSQKLEATLGQVNNFALVLVFEFVVRLDLTVCDASNMLDDVLGLSDKSNQSLILGLKELQECPDSDVLECRITRLKEAAEVSVNSTLGLGPVLHKDRVVADFGGKVAKSSSTVALDFDAWGVSKRNQDTADSKVEEVRLEVVAESQNRNSGGHFGLNSDRDIENQLFALLHRASIQNKGLVAIGTGCKVSECGNGVALNFLVIGGSEQVDKRLEEVGLDNR